MHERSTGLHFNSDSSALLKNNDNANFTEGPGSEYQAILMSCISRFGVIPQVSANDNQYELIAPPVTPFSELAVYVQVIPKVSLYPPTKSLGTVIVYGEVEATVAFDPTGVFALQETIAALVVHVLLKSFSA